MKLLGIAIDAAAAARMYIDVVYSIRRPRSEGNICVSKMKKMYKWKCKSNWIKVIEMAQTCYLKKKIAFVKQEDQV